MARRLCTISAMRVTWTCKPRTNRLMLRVSGRMKCSRKISPGWIGGSDLGCLLLDRANQGLQVVIDNFYVVCVSVTPDETDPPLIVNSDTVLPVPVTFKRFKPIPWRGRHVSQFGSAV